MNACFSGVCRDADQGVYPSGTDGDSADQGVQRVCRVLCECLEYVLVRQPTVILRVSAL